MLCACTAVLDLSRQYFAGGAGWNGQGLISSLAVVTIMTFSLPLYAAWNDASAATAELLSIGPTTSQKRAPSADVTFAG